MTDPNFNSCLFSGRLRWGSQFSAMQQLLFTTVKRASRGCRSSSGRLRLLTENKPGSHQDQFRKHYSKKVAKVGWPPLGKGSEVWGRVCACCFMGVPAAHTRKAYDLLSTFLVDPPHLCSCVAVGDLPPVAPKSRTPNPGHQYAHSVDLASYRGSTFWIRPGVWGPVHRPLEPPAQHNFPTLAVSYIRGLNMNSNIL